MVWLFLVQGAASVPQAGEGNSWDFWLNVATATFAFFALVATWLKLMGEASQSRARRRLVERSEGFYSDEQLQRATRYYVLPDCSNLDPATEAEPEHHFAVKEPLFETIDRFLSKKSSTRHLLLLADSGMGKSSCLINYYVRNQKRWRRRHRIAIVPLGIPNADELISKVEQKGDTVLFLDAFDEDTRAVSDHLARLDQLMKLSADFRRVVLTCRTQFFLSEEDVPRLTGILRVEPRSGREGGVYEFWKLYLLPLSEGQVEAFLKKRFGLFHWQQRRKARKLIQAVPNLSVRPMLLGAIPDLLESSQAVPSSNPSELYACLIEAWYLRESAWVDPEILRDFSEKLAVDLFVRREERKSERIAPAEVASLAKQWGLGVEGWKLTGRSLLNRDAAGNFKFAHRSIMEYLVAKQIFSGVLSPAAADWSDEVIRFVCEEFRLCRNRELPSSMRFEDCRLVPMSWDKPSWAQWIEELPQRMPIRVGAEAGLDDALEWLGRDLATIPPPAVALIEALKGLERNGPLRFANFGTIDEALCSVVGFVADIFRTQDTLSDQNIGGARRGMQIVLVPVGGRSPGTILNRVWVALTRHTGH